MEHTDQQLAIFDNVAHGAGNTLVTARAGSSKTYSSVESLQFVDPKEQCLYLAFGREDAAELTRRIKQPNVRVATCHSFGLAQIRENLGNVGIDHNLARTVASRYVRNRSHQYVVAKAVGLAKAFMLGGSDVDALADLIDRFDIIEDPGVSASEIASWAAIVMRASVLDRDTFDYDDMIWYPVATGMAIEQFDRVFVDEAQDLTLSQIELALSALRPGGRLMAIGDDRQSIYKFRGADRDAMKTFASRLNPTHLPLSVSFRCAESIIREAQRYVPDIQARHNAPYGEVAAASLTRALDTVEYGDAILSRLNAPLVSAAMKLMATDCRVKMLGRDIGASMQGLVKKFRAHSVVDLQRSLDAWVVKVRNTAPEDGGGFRVARAAEDKARSLQALAGNCKTINEVLSRIDRLFVDKDDGSNCVTLASTHKAKGREWNRVFMLRDTYTPRPSIAPIEEQNLLYVATTRAKNSLTIVSDKGVR